MYFVIICFVNLIKGLELIATSESEEGEVGVAARRLSLDKLASIPELTKKTARKNWASSTNQRNESACNE